MLRSRLQQVSEVSNDLREELSRTKNECLQLEGTKVTIDTKYNQKCLQLEGTKVAIDTKYNQKCLQLEGTKVAIDTK